MRKATILLCATLFTLTSLSQKMGFDTTAKCDMLTTLKENDRFYRTGDFIDTFAKTRSDYPKKIVDSIWVLQRKLDVYNTETLLQLTKDYGWLNNERVNCPELDIWLIFRHSDKQYFDEISQLIDYELAAERLDSFEHKMIRHHLQGRPKRQN